MAFTQQQNTQLAQTLGLIGANTTAGNGVVQAALQNASPAVQAAYQSQRQLAGDTTYTYQPTAPSTPAATPAQSLPAYQANQVTNPSLSSAATVTPQLLSVTPDEQMTNNYGIGSAPLAQGAPGVQAPTINQTQANTSLQDPNAAAAMIDPTKGQYSATNMGPAVQGTAAQGQVKPLDTVQGQLTSLYANTVNGQTPTWAQGAVNTANDAMASRGLGASSIAAGAITAAVQQSALNIAAQDASTYYNMDVTNLGNQQQMALQNTQILQQDMLTDNSVQNAASQFNASSANQTQQFTASLVSQINSQNQNATNSMSQFNAAQANTISAQNASANLSAQTFNASQLNTLNQFNSSLQNQVDQFNSQMQFAVDQSNVLWNRAVNTDNTAAVNAANQVNAQNAFNLSNTALQNLSQQFQDSASWAFTASQNQAQMAFNAAQAANNQSFIQNLNQTNMTYGAATASANLISNLIK